MTRINNYDNIPSYLIGFWVSSDISLPKNAKAFNLEVLQTLKHDLSQSTFLFKADYTGTINIKSIANHKDNDSAFNMIWTFDELSSLLSCVAQNDKDATAEIFEVERVGENLKITIDGEFPMTFTLERLLEQT